MTAWKSRMKRNTAKCTIKIPVDQIAIIRNSIATYGSREYVSLKRGAGNKGAEKKRVGSRNCRRNPKINVLH
jgi:hypothetical protein